MALAVPTSAFAENPVGKVPSGLFRQTETRKAKGFAGLFVRSDKLNEWGMEVPSTIDEWTAVFAKAKAEGFDLPFVYNCGGYENIDSLKKLEGKINIYIPDLKYADDNLAFNYSGVKNYFETATKAIKEMFSQVGKYKIDENEQIVIDDIIEEKEDTNEE